MNRQQGIVKLVLTVIIAVLILSYFRFDLRRLVENELTQENLAYVWSLIKQLWSYLSALVIKISHNLTNN